MKLILPRKYKRALKKATFTAFRKDIEFLKRKLINQCIYCYKKSTDINSEGFCSICCYILKDCKEKTLRLNDLIVDFQRKSRYRICCWNKESLCSMCLDDFEKDVKDLYHMRKDYHQTKSDANHYKLMVRWLSACLILVILSFLFVPRTLKAAELRKITRSPRIESMRALDITLHAADALGIEPEDVKCLIMKRVDNYDKLAAVAFPLKGQDVEELKQYLLKQCILTQ